jgi:ABC-type branched-subunit amino acid transport system substrate-binding protein
VRPQIRILAALGAFALLAAGCGRSGSTGAQAPATAAQASAGTAQAAPGDFGALKNVCHGGGATGATGLGVTSSQIKVGVLTDEGFTHDPQLVNAAKAFTSWCNAAGGINGRKIVADIRDTKLLQVVPQVTGACSADFVLAGGSAALDALEVKPRLSCLLPEFPAQVVAPQNVNSDLQAYPQTDGHSYAPYAGYYSWLTKEAYPDSLHAVGILYGNSPITNPIVQSDAETIKGIGGTASFSEGFPATGVTDWTPYAEAVKNKGVKGLIFNGTPQWLAAFELALDNIGYKLDWIDANSNSYGTAFTHLAGKSLTLQHNYAALAGYYPVEKASANPATQQLTKVFAQYAAAQPLTLQVMQAFSAWLLFAVSAETCGSDLTRKCVYEAALKQTTWTAGGLQAPVDLAKPDSPVSCYNVEQATPQGWQPAAFKPNNGVYRCGAPVYKLQGSYPQPVTLKDVGKSLSDLK